MSGIDAGSTEEDTPPGQNWAVSQNRRRRFRLTGEGVGQKKIAIDATCRPSRELSWCNA